MIPGINRNNCRQGRRRKSERFAGIAKEGRHLDPRALNLEYCRCLQFNFRFRILRGFRTAGVAQLVEHLICNQRVGGSNPFASSS